MGTFADLIKKYWTKIIKNVTLQRSQSADISNNDYLIDNATPQN